MRNQMIAGTVSALLLAGGVQAQDWESSLSLALGSKDLREGDNQLADEHNAIGFLFDVREQSWPVNVAVDVFGSGREKRGAHRYDSEAAEVHIGLRKVFDLPSNGLQPYLGGGFAWGEIKETTYIDDLRQSARGDGVGYWLGTGVRYKFSDSFSVGVDLRHSRLGEGGSGGGTFFGISTGYHW